MEERIIDIIVTLGIFFYLIIKYKDNKDWFFLIFIWVTLNILFNVVVLLRSLEYLTIDVYTLNTLSRGLKWFGISSCLYYALRGEQ